MQRIRLALVTLFITVTLLWLATAGGITGGYPRFWPLRADMVHYSGALAISAMSVAIYLAIRPQWLERLLGGLDKSYRLHKWLGIGVLVVSTVHWGWAQIPKWLVGLGWLAAPARRGAGKAEDGLLGWLHGQRGFAEDTICLCQLEEKEGPHPSVFPAPGKTTASSPSRSRGWGATPAICRKPCTTAMRLR